MKTSQEYLIWEEQILNAPTQLKLYCQKNLKT